MTLLVVGLVVPSLRTLYRERTPVERTLYLGSKCIFSWPPLIRAELFGRRDVLIREELYCSNMAHKDKKSRQ